MKKFSRVIAVVLTLCMTLTAMATLTACPDKGFEMVSFTVDRSSIQTTYKVGDAVDFSGIKATIRYTDEQYNKELGFSDLEIVYSDSITETAGVKTVTVKYKDVTGKERKTTIDITVEAKGEVSEKSSVASFALPATIVNFGAKVEAAKNSVYGSATFEDEYIQDEDNVYYVGAANDFKITPVLKVYDEKDRPQVVSKYRTVTEIYMDGASTPLISSLIDEENNVYSHVYGDAEYAKTYDAGNAIRFTSAANGHTFKISIAFDKDSFVIDEDDIDSVSEKVEFTVKVIDAYNVYAAKELTLIDNMGSRDDRGNDNTADAYEAFKEANGLSGVEVKGVVLHNDISVTYNDIPSCYYEKLSKTYEYKSDKGEVLMTAEAFMKDKSNIYARRILKDETFSIIGNFFTIDCSKMPLAPSPAVAEEIKKAEYGGIQISDYGSDYSNISLIRIFGDKSEDAALSGKAIVKNIRFIGNANRNEIVDSKGKLVSAGGLICLKSEDSGVDYHNTIQNRFFISIFPNDGGVTNANKIKVFDSYQNAVFIYGGGTLNINDSYMLRAGGPLCIIQHLDPQSNTDSHIPTVNATNSVLESYCDGKETWFDSVGATETAAQLKLLNNFFLTAKTSKVMLDANDKMNIICVNMSNGTNANETVKNLYTQGKFVITKDGKTATLNRMLTATFYKDLVMPVLTEGAIVLNVADSAENKSFVWLDGKFNAYSGATGNLFAPSTENLADAAIWDTFNTADNFAVNMGGFGMMFGLCNVKQAAEN